MICLTESGDPNSIRAIFDEALPCGDDVKLYYLAIFVREMFVMNLCKDNTAIPEKFGANRVVFPNGSAKKTPTPNTANHNPSVPITSMLGMVTLPRVSDLLDTNDNASKGSGSDIPSHSSASSQDELVRQSTSKILTYYTLNQHIMTIQLHYSVKLRL